MSRFSGSDYDPEYDDMRLSTQMGRVYSSMKKGEWKTLGELETETHAPQSSILAQLRHLRKGSS